MSFEELVEYYRGYISNYDIACKGSSSNAEISKNHANLYRLSFSSTGITLQQIEDAASKHAESIAYKYFEALFPETQDVTAFCLKCNPSRPVWSQRNNKLNGVLTINDGVTTEDKPHKICVNDFDVTLFWGKDYFPQRDIDFGPAIVEIKANKSFVGRHIVNGSFGKGHSDWRKRCAQHNLWMNLCK